MGLVEHLESTRLWWYAWFMNRIYQVANLVGSQGRRGLGQFSKFTVTRLTSKPAKAEIDASRAKLAEVQTWKASLDSRLLTPLSFLSQADAQEFATLYDVVMKDKPAIDHIYDLVAPAWAFYSGYLDQNLIDDLTEWGEQVSRLQELTVKGKAKEASGTVTVTSATGTPGQPEGAAQPANTTTKNVLIGAGLLAGIGGLAYIMSK